MLLNHLSEREKELFLELCHLIANIDQEYSQEEMSYIEDYRSEMGLSEYDYSLQGLSYSEIVHEIRSISSKENRRRIIIEIMALVKADGRLHDHENELLNRLKGDFDLEGDILKRIIGALDEVTKAYGEIYAIVEGR